ncbi:protein translocase subunit SecD [Desulfovibrio sp. OttesenSCG-928-I05]|nr:protein translocase subunit SecD [Desulfovibrio sp. OttesenSCG-928-I05]
MRQGLTWRLILTLLVILTAVVYLLPGTSLVQNSSLKRFLPDARINQGLDLMGGIHLTLGVDVDKAVENSLTQTGQAIRSYAREKNIVVLRPHLLAGETLEFILAKPEQQAEFDELLAKSFPQLVMGSSQPAPDGGLRYTATLRPEDRREMTSMALKQVLTAIRNRIDQFGVAEPDIREQPEVNRIVLQLPGIKDADRAIQIVGQTAHLEFKLVRDDVDPSRASRGLLPPGTEVLQLQGKAGTAPVDIVVNKEALMTGEYISDAAPAMDSQNNQPYVRLSFNSRGAGLFERVTGDNVGKRMAIVLDGKAHSAPVIQQKIGGGVASITGSFTTVEAQDLALVLRAGSLPAPVTILEERTVGPSLGQESIDQGVKAALVGGIAVILFMALYYGLSGLIADLMLILDVLFILAGMAFFGATLTLPGIAGIVLTLGMAVDANVLVFERIREELRAGLTPLAAIRTGFARATVAIMDSNLTTIFAAIVLYQFGTGPIRGFAVTLTLGILASMFTAVFVSHLVYDLWMGPKGRKLSI